MKRKKVLSVILSLLLILSSCCIGLYSFANAKKVDVNVLLLDSIIKERPWVIESLVVGRFTNNPYTNVLPYATEETYFEEILSNYKNDDSLKFLVDSMVKYEETGTYVGSWTQETAANLLKFLGLASDEELNACVDKHVKSIEDLQYESIINAVLLENYTSSWGSTLMEADATLEQYRQMSEVLKNISNYQRALKSNSGLLATGYFESFEDFTDYTDTFLDAYENALYDALSNLTGYNQTSDDILAKKIVSATAMAFVFAAETYDPTKANNISDGVSSELNDFYADYFAPEINAILKGAGTVLQFSSVAIEYAMLLEALVSQTNNTVQVMGRVQSNTTDENLYNTLNVYSDMIADQGNKQALNYDVILNYIDNQNKIGTAILQSTEKAFNNFAALRYGVFEASELVITRALCRKLIQVGQCIEVALWVTDKATNVQDTCRKIYLCQYINKIISAARDTYNADYLTYVNNPTDENAKKCLDDLEFLKKLRLYGEKQAYGSVCSQTESIVGTLLGGDVAQKTLDKRYQANIDAILGCSLAPANNVEFNINKGEELLVYVRMLDNGNETYYARLTKSDGTIVEFPEADTILTSSINLNGGTISLLGKTDGTNSNYFIPSLTATKDSILEIENSNVAIGMLKNTGDLSLSIEGTTSTLKITDTLYNSDTLQITTSSGQGVSTQNVTNSGSLTIVNSAVRVYGNIENNSQISGVIRICGDGTKTYNEGYFEVGTQTISGTGNYTVLHFDNHTNDGVEVKGKTTVSDEIYWLVTKIKNSTNIILTGTACLNGDAIKGDISAKNWNCTKSAEINGTLFALDDIIISDGVTLNVVNYKQSDGNLVIAKTGTLICEDLLLGCITTNNGTISVDGDSKVTDSFIGGAFNSKGDITVSANFAPHSLSLNSKLSQRFYNSSTTTVNKLDISNSSFSGITVDSVINVVDIFINNAKKIINSNNIRLKDGGNYITNGVSKYDFTVSESYTVKSGETFIVNGNLTLNSGAVLTVEDGAKLVVKRNIVSKGANIIVSSGGCIEIVDYINSSSDTYQIDGDLIVKGDARITSAIVNANGLITFKGDLTVSSGTWNNPNVAFVSKLPQVVSGSAINVNDITIDNTSKSGITITLTYTAAGKVDILHLSADNTGEETTEPETQETTEPVTDCDGNEV